MNFYEIIDILINMRLEESTNSYYPFRNDQHNAAMQNTFVCPWQLKLCPCLALLQNTVAVCHYETDTNVKFKDRLTFWYPTIMTDDYGFITENMLATGICHSQYYRHIHAMGFPVIRSVNKFSVRKNQWFALSRSTEITLVMYIRHNYVRVTNCIRCILSRWVAFNLNNRRNNQCWLLI